VIQQVKVPISDTDNVGDVHDRLMMLGGKLVVETVDNIINGTVTSVEQDDMLSEGEDLRPAPKIFHDTCRIDWKGMNMKQIYDFIRGLSPYPAAWTELVNGDKVLSVKIFEAEKIPADSSQYNRGAILTDGKSEVKVAVDGGFLRVKTLQIAGKKKMQTEEFLRGYKFVDDAVFL
jgi:methionyl-tRNA formyltransferase